MRKKRLKAMSLALALAVSVSGLNPALASQVSAKEKKSAVSEEITGEADITEEEVENVVEETSEVIQEDDSDDGAISFIDPKEATTQYEAASEDDYVGNTSSFEDVEAYSEGVYAELENAVEKSAPEVKVSAQAVDSNTKLSTVITDSALLKYVASALGSTTSNATVGQLMAYSGDIDVSGFSEKASIKSMEGLQYAKKVKNINLTGTAITVVPNNIFSSKLSTEDEAGLALTSITLPYTVTEIGEYAFENCTNLKSVNTVDKNGTLKKDTLPELTKAGKWAFVNTALENITFDAKDEAGIAYQTAESMFAGCKSLLNVKIGENVTYIPSAMFMRSGDETAGMSVTFGSSVSKINANAFELATFPNDISYVVDLSRCSDLDEIGEAAFRSANVVNIKLPAGIQRLALKKYVFAGSALKTLYAANQTSTYVDIPNYVTEIGEGCFCAIRNMQKVSISANISAIEDYVFDLDKNLKTVEQKVVNGNCNIKSIGDCSFRGTAIENTDFLLKMNKLEVIGKQHLEGYTIGKGVTLKAWEGNLSDEEKGGASLPVGGLITDEKEKIIIDDKAQKKNSKGVGYGSDTFASCYFLKSVSLPASVTTIGSRAFYCNIKDARTGKPAGEKGDYYHELKDSYDPALESIVWNSSTTPKNRVIYAGAFQGNTNLKTISLPYCSGDSLEIGEFAFAAAGADQKESSDLALCANNGKNILPASITSIKDGAFMECFSLKNVKIQDKNGVCPAFGDAIFYMCDQMTEATLPDSVKVISKKMFYSDPLEKFPVVNGSSLEKIDILAFMGHQFKSVDLSKHKNLTEIEAGVFAFIDAIDPKDYKESVASKMITDTKYPSYFDTKDPAKLGKMEELILPSTLNGDKTMFLNTALFYGQLFFDTIKTPSYNKNQGTIYIPSYVLPGNKVQALFGLTGVSKVVWQSDLEKTQKNLWKNVSPLMFIECGNIKNTEDVLPNGDYVESIGKGAFINSSVEIADFSKYIHLKEISTKSDNITGDTGAFYNCYYLTNVYLPYTTDSQLIIREKTFASKGTNSTKKEICLGNVVTIENNAFEKNAGVSTFSVVDAAKQSKYATDKSVVVDTGVAVLPQSLTTIGNNSFKECSGIKNLEFTKQTKIGTSCFESCTGLTSVKFTPELVTLPSKAFYSCDAIEEIQFDGQKTIGNNSFGKAGCDKCVVKFDSALEKIDANGFNAAGVKAYDFSEATNLSVIGTNAFSYNSNLVNFELSGTKVTSISQILQNCNKLKSASFGKELDYIGPKTITKAPDFQELTISDKTIIDRNMLLGSGSGDETAHNVDGKIRLKILQPEPFIVPLGRYEYLPYAINLKGQSSFKTILIGDSKDAESDNSDIQNLMKIRGDFADGAYWGSLSKTDGDFYKITDNFVNEKIYRSKMTKAGSATEVDGIMLEGLKEGSTTITLAATLQLATESEKGMIETYPFNVTYDVKVKPIRVYSDAYTDKAHTAVIKNGKEFVVQASAKNKGVSLIYYNARPDEGIQTAVDTSDLIIKTSDPEVVIPSSSTSTKAGYDANNGCLIKVSDANGNASADKKKFYLIPKKTGSAKITVYLKGHEDAAQTFTYKVESDIKTLALQIPDSLLQDSKNGLKKGTTFNAFGSYTNVFGATYKAGDKVHYSNMYNSIVYTSSEPKYVTVDKTGKVTVVKESESGVKSVVIKATVATAEGGSVSSSLTIKIKEAGAALSQPVKDSSGVTYVPTVDGDEKNPGEVTYTLPKDKATEIKIPDTVKIKNIVYKVTAIDPKAFQNNKNIKSVSIGKYVRAIPNNTFSGCTALTKVVIPDDVITIGTKAFYNCKKLKTVTISSKSNLTSIGANAFQKCSALTAITIPKKLKTIGANAFNGCKKLTKINVLSTKLKKVGKKALKGTNKSLVISVPKKQYKKYKKLFKSKGQSKKAKIVKK